MSATPHCLPTPSLLEAALGYAACGLSVFPCRRDKRPLTEHGFTDATTDPDTIRAWWHHWPSALIGIAVPAGYVVIDIDGPEGWAALKAEGLLMPATMSAITGRGEWHRHLWYRLPTGIQLRNAVALRPHVDLRSLGGYVIAPPSVSAYGPYRWVRRFDLGNVSHCPEWVVERASRTETNAPTPTSKWRELVAGVAEGQRNNTVVRLAGHLLRRYVDPYVALELLRTWNTVRCSPPLPDDEVVRAVDSVARRELQRRGGVE